LWWRGGHNVKRDTPGAGRALRQTAVAAAILEAPVISLPPPRPRISAVSLALAGPSERSLSRTHRPLAQTPRRANDSGCSVAIGQEVGVQSQFAASWVCDTARVTLDASAVALSLPPHPASQRGRR